MFVSSRWLNRFPVVPSPGDAVFFYLPLSTGLRRVSNIIFPPPRDNVCLFFASFSQCSFPPVVSFLISSYPFCRDCLLGEFFASSLLHVCSRPCCFLVLSSPCCSDSATFSPLLVGFGLFVLSSRWTSVSELGRCSSLFFPSKNGFRAPSGKQLPAL